MARLLDIMPSKIVTMIMVAGIYAAMIWAQVTGWFKLYLKTGN